MIKHIILIILMSLLSIETFASKVGETSKKHNFEKKLSKDLSYDFMRKLYYDFEKQMQAYNKKATIINKMKKINFSKLSKTSSVFMKKLKLNKMPIFKRTKTGYSYTSGQYKLFVSMSLQIQNAVKLNGKKIFFFGKDNNEVISNIYKSIKGTKLKKTSFINFVLSSALADSSHQIEEYDDLGKSGIAMFYAMITYWDWEINDDPEYYKKEIKCKLKHTQRNLKKTQLSECLYRKFILFAKEAKASCSLKLKHEQNFTKKMSDSRNLTNYRRNPDKNSQRNFITLLEYMYQDKSLRFDNGIDWSVNVAYFYNKHYHKDNLKDNEKKRVKDNLQNAKSIFQQYFPIATEKGINSCHENMRKATKAEKAELANSKDISYRRKRQLQSLKQYKNLLCTHLMGLDSCISHIYLTQKEVVQIFDRAREKDKDIQRKYLEEDSRIYDDFHFYHLLQDKFYEK